ncbi:repressor LexA [Peptoanaerobacter stomatis]|uniref:Repressor LexA n=1 Tax=Peptoanaerobacter stomatis TaxID=796937 RepID=J6HAV0_9FIRM|nr:transcriptional repressor LexA [Peptoanaerobacter stomatis]EJU19983.1 repressor LexA [Peptoanaerobacter stomatis]NWO25060.1 repressor LexA [Peptostreptococcaceae bacterium oral taxon 081]
MKKELNANEARTYEYIKWYLSENGFSPSISDIETSLDLKSTSTVHRILKLLEEKNYINRQSNKNRSITLVDGIDEYDYKNNITLLPLIEYRNIDFDVFDKENVQDYIPVPNNWISKGEFFITKANDDSMIDAGIYNADLLIVQKIQTLRNGEIAVALINDRNLTVKRFYMEKQDRIRLQPENSNYDAIYFKNIRILGRVKKCIRSFF